MIIMRILEGASGGDQNEHTEIPTNEEIQRMYKLYCSYAVIVFDLATSKQLYENRSYSWAITSGYYSLMHMGRFICLLGIGEYPTHHSNLYKFLNGNNGNRIRDFDHTFDELIGQLKMYSEDESLEEEIKKFGLYLGKVKEIRENNSYDFFIIYHQINHSILSAQFERVFKIISDLMNHYFKIVSELFFDYIEHDKNKAYFVAFLRDSNPVYEWTFKALNESMKAQLIKDNISKDIFDRINEYILDKLIVEIKLPDSFYAPLKYETFSAKNIDMNNFISNIDNLESSAT